MQRAFRRLTLPFSELKIIYMSFILFLMHNFRPIYQNKHYFITSVPALFRNRSNLILFVYFTFYLLGYSATNIVYFNKALFYCLTFISLDFKSKKQKKTKKRLFGNVIFKIRELN